MKQTRKIADIIEVEEIHDIIDQGTTMPVRCRLKNGMDVVVKYMRNPYGQQALVNEWIGSCIADRIGLTIPEFGLCNFSEDVIINSNNNEEIDQRNAGCAFYTKYYPKTVPMISINILSDVKNHETEKLILFDHLVNNNDRHNGNLLCDISKDATLYIIDNSHIITDEPKTTFVIEESLKDGVIFSNKILNTNKDVYDVLCIAIGYSEDKLRECAIEMKKVLSENFLLEVKKSIPKAWCESIGYEKLEQMFEVLNKRTSVLCEIAEMIIKERRKL